MGAILFEAWRSGRGITQCEVARLLEIGDGSVSALERGRRRPGLQWATLIEERTAGAVPATSWTKYPGRG